MLDHQTWWRAIQYFLQEIMLKRRVERMAELKLVSSRKKKRAHVDGKKVAAVAAPHRHCFKQAAVRDADGEDCVAKVAVDIA